MNLSKSTRFTTVLSSVGYAILLVIMPPLMAVWTGGKLSADPALTLVLAVGALLVAPFTPIAAYLNLVGEARLVAISRVVTVILAVMLSALFVKPFGIFGIAAALAAAEVLGLAGVCLAATARYIGTTPGRLVTRSLLDVARGTLPVLLVAQLLPQLADRPLADLTLKCLLLAPLALASLLCMGLSRDERAWLRGRLIAHLEFICAKRRPTR